MLERQEITKLIATATESLLPQGQLTGTAIDENTTLVGSGALLDSAALVSLIVEIEQQIDDAYGFGITIADERALSQQRSPFRTVGTLADYVLKLCREASGAARG